MAEKEISCADSCEDISAALTQAASHLGFDNCSCMISIASSFKSRCFQFIGEHLERCARESFDNWPLFRKGVIQDHMNDEGMIVLEGDHFLDRNTGGRGQENRENFGVACVVFPRPPITGVVVLARESKSISSVFVIQVYVPGMERFNFIRSGKWVAPHAALLHSSLDKES
nr:hypothetical protein [Pseudomonas sp. A46]